MTNNVTIKAADIFAQINLPFANHAGNNAVVEYLTDYYGVNEYSSISDLARDLEMAHHSAGSFGMCYTTELDDFLKANLDDIEEVLEFYLDATDEPFSVMSFSDLVAIALDVAANEIASALEFSDLAIVVNHADYMDTNPEVIICDKYYADEKVYEIIQHRLDMEVQHSPETVTEEDRDEMEETLLQLVYTLV